MVIFTKEDASKELPYIEDKNLFRAVDMALWLYLDRGFSLKNSVDIAARKHTVKPKIAIERMMRKVIPEEVFHDRVKAVSGSGKMANHLQKISKLESDAKKHVSSVVSGD